MKLWAMPEAPAILRCALCALLLSATAKPVMAQDIGARADEAAISLAREVREAFSESLSSLRFLLNSDLRVTTAAIWNDQGELAFPDRIHEHVRLELSERETDALRALLGEADMVWRRSPLQRNRLIFCLAAESVCLLLDREVFSASLGADPPELDARLFAGESGGVSFPAVPGLVIAVALIALVIALAVRLRRATRPTPAPEDPAGFRLSDIEISPSRLKAVRAGVESNLTRRDVAILRHMYDHRGAVVSKDELYDAAWGRDYMPNSRALDQHIRSLRRKLDPDQSRAEVIETVHGAGYRLNC